MSHSRLSISRRRVPGPRAASASTAVSTHSRGRPWPRAARTRSLTHFLACHVPDRAPFSLQTPVERSERLAGGWAVRARANPLSLGVWHFTLRFVLPRSWVGHPSRRPQGCGMQSPSGPKVYPDSHEMLADGDGECFICRDSSPVPIQSGCACRGAAGHAHTACRAHAAVVLSSYTGFQVWWECQTCNAENDQERLSASQLL